MLRKVYSGVVLATLVAMPVHAGNLFSLSATVDQSTVHQSYSAIEDLFEAVDNESLLTLFDSGVYSDVSATDVVLNIRGLPATTSYAANSNTLLFEVPVLGISETFTGQTRDESQELMEAYLKANGDGIMTKMLNYTAANTPVDPVAGNPNSLMSGMGSADFGLATDFGGGGQLSDMKTSSTSNSVSVGFRFGSYSVDDYTQDVYTLPIRYTIRFDSDPRKQLIFDLPLLYTDTNGSDSYNASLGVGLRLPVNDDWSITPAVRGGAVGSLDMGSASILYSGSLTSNYNLYWDDIKVIIGNMAAYYKTVALDTGDFEIDYDLTNSMIKNGIGLEGPLDYIMLGSPTSWQVDMAHTAFFGDDLYIDNYVDVSMSFGTRATESSWDNLRFGLTFTVGNNDYQGYRINFGYTF